jgi:hypothetical protein
MKFLMVDTASANLGEITPVRRLTSSSCSSSAVLIGSYLLLVLFSLLRLAGQLPEAI